MSTRFTRDHEWVRMEGDIAIVGITGHAAEQLGDVVFVELPDVGRAFAQKDDMAVVESVKAASDVYAPIDGEIVEINASIVDEPAKVNEDPDGASWFVKIKPTNPSQIETLMDEAAYKEFVESE